MGDNQFNEEQRNYTNQLSLYVLAQKLDALEKWLKEQALFQGCNVKVDKKNRTVNITDGNKVRIQVTQEKDGSVVFKGQPLDKLADTMVKYAEKHPNVPICIDASSPAKAKAFIKKFIEKGGDPNKLSKLLINGKSEPEMLKQLINEASKKSRHKPT